MSKGAQTKLVHSKFLLHPNCYVKAMYDQYRTYVLDEEDCLKLKGRWRQKAFRSTFPHEKKLDLEIGPGSGEFFLHTVLKHKDRLFTALELKYKPLIQTARKIKNHFCANAKTARYNARLLKDLFAPKELNNIYIHFPDPWPKKRHHKHRLINKNFASAIHWLMRKGSFVEIKTDHQEYFQEIQQVFENSMFQVKELCGDLHKNKNLSAGNFITPFERIFIKKNQPVYYLKLIK